jgi:hypothetical protein
MEMFPGKQYGWLERFISRHGLSPRAVTSQGQKVPANAKDLASAFMKYTHEKTLSESLEFKAIGNMDETPM